MLFKQERPVDKSVNYILNQDGYRCPDWTDINWQDSHLLFGCSVAQGIGLNSNETLDFHLSNLLDSPVINLGVSGGSLPFLLANTYKLIDAGVRPKSVILVYPEPSRIALFLKEKVHHVGTWAHESWYRTWLKDNNAEYYGYLAGRSIESAWTALDIDVVSVHQPDVPGPEDLPRYVDVAKDGQHPGPKTIKLWAEHIVKKKAHRSELPGTGLSS
jgi:hypothetical protein